MKNPPLRAGPARPTVPPPITTEQLDQAFQELASLHPVQLAPRRSNFGPTAPRASLPTNPFAGMRLVTLPLVINPDKRGLAHGLSADRIISLLLEYGFPRSILEAMNTEKNLFFTRKAVEAKYKKFDFKEWFFETSQKIDAENTSLSTAPNGLKHTEVARRFVAGLVEFDKANRYNGLTVIKLEPALYEAVSTGEPNTRIIDTLSATQTRVVRQIAASHLSEVFRNIQSDESKAAFRKAYEICGTYPSVNDFFKSAFELGTHGFVISILLTKDEHRRKNNIKQLQVIHHIHSRRSQHEPTEFDFPTQILSEIAKIPSEDINNMQISVAKKGAALFLEKETHTRSDFSKAQEAELNTFLDKMLANLINSNSEQPKVLKNAATSILLSEIKTVYPIGAKSMVMISRTTKDVRLFRTRMAEGCRKAKQEIETRRQTTDELDAKEFYGEMINILEFGNTLFSDNDHYSSREMDILSTSILALENQQGDFLPDSVPEVEVLSNIILDDVDTGLKRKYLFSGKSLPESFTELLFGTNMKYIPEFLFHQ
jgi:hypothetical protein